MLLQALPKQSHPATASLSSLHVQVPHVTEDAAVWLPPAPPHSDAQLSPSSCARCHRLGHSRRGIAAPDYGAEQTCSKKTLSFPQTGVDPGKVYLARKKYVKQQEKGTAQQPTKLPKFLLRQNKVSQFGVLCCGIRSQVKQLLLTGDLLHCLPITFTTSCLLSFQPALPFLPTAKTLRCRKTGNGWEQESHRDG